MAWEKLGRIFYPDGEIPWMASHASLPLPVKVGDERVRVREPEPHGLDQAVHVVRRAPRQVAQVDTYQAPESRLQQPGQ